MSKIQSKRRLNCLLLRVLFSQLRQRLLLLNIRKNQLRWSSHTVLVAATI